MRTPRQLLAAMALVGAFVGAHGAAWAPASASAQVADNPFEAPPAAVAEPTSPDTSGEGAPAPEASAAPESDPGPLPPDVGPVRAEVASVMDAMVQLRQRIALVARELFRTRIRIAVQDRAGDDQSLARFVVELDGAPVFRTDGEIEGGDRGRVVHEGALAPGPHVLTIETEQRAREDAEVRYSQRETFRIQVHRDRLTDVEIVLDDDSSMVEAFRRGGEGRYDIRTRVRVATRELPAGSPPSGS